jgi:hypothetical protein
MTDNVWHPRFKIGDQIDYMGKIWTITEIDYVYKRYGFENGLLGSGIIIDNGVSGMPGYLRITEPATLRLWHPRFNIGEQINYMGQRMTIREINPSHNSYTVEINNGLVGVNGKIVDNGVKSKYPGIPDTEPATRIRVRGGQTKTRRNTKKRKSIRRKHRNFNRRPV